MDQILKERQIKKPKLNRFFYSCKIFYINYQCLLAWNRLLKKKQRKEKEKMCASVEHVIVKPFIKGLSNGIYVKFSLHHKENSLLFFIVALLNIHCQSPNYKKLSSISWSERSINVRRARDSLLNANKCIDLNQK